MSTLKVGTIQDHTNSNTAINIDSAGRVFTPQRPMFKISGRTDSSYTPPINNSTAFQFGNTVFANGFTVSNTFSRVTVPVTGKYYLKTVIQHVGPSVNTETRYMGTNIRKNTSYISQNLEALVAVSDGWGDGNSYHTTYAEYFGDLAADDFLEVVLGRSSSSDWDGTIYADGTADDQYTFFYGYLIG
jgi:hypothetical protein